jgi:hypothetical protein
MTTVGRRGHADSEGTTWGDVAPFLPFGRNNGRQNAAKRGTRRNRKTRRFVGHQCAIQQLTASQRKARLTPWFPATNQEVASSSLAGRTNYLLRK